MMSKQEIRRQMEARRRALDEDTLAAAGTRIIDRLCGLEVFRQAETVGLYMAAAGEVNLDPLLNVCRSAGKRTAIPLFREESRSYAMSLVSPDTPFRTGHYGIREPRTPAPCPVEQIELMVVPGVAFDRTGRRLGRGGGYYDRLLAGFPHTAAAVALDFQLLPEIPSQTHDLPVRLIVTEKRVINVLKED